jgi:hypothetical protein
MQQTMPMRKAVANQHTQPMPHPAGIALTPTAQIHRTIPTRQPVMQQHRPTGSHPAAGSSAGTPGAAQQTQPHPSESSSDDVRKRAHLREKLARREKERWSTFGQQVQGKTTSEKFRMMGNEWQRRRLAPGQQPKRTPAQLPPHVSSILQSGLGQGLARTGGSAAGGAGPSGAAQQSHHGKSTSERFKMMGDDWQRRKLGPGQQPKPSPAQLPPHISSILQSGLGELGTRSPSLAERASVRVHGRSIVGVH